MSRVTDFEVKWRKQKQIEEAEKKQKEEAKNTSILETFSPQKYSEMKKNGQIVFDTDIVDNYFSNGYDYVNEIKNNIANPSYINSKTFPNSERYGNINNNSDYVRLYIESLKGTDEYDSLKKQYDDYNSAMSYYNNAAKQMKDFASIFGDEEHYNNAIKDIQNSETEEDKILKYIAYISGRKTFGDESFSDTLSNSNNISLPKSFTTGTQGLNGKEEVLKYWNVLSYAKNPNLLFNADMSKQYGDYSYTDLIKEAEKYKSSPKEYNWIKNRAETVATSEDLQAEYDSLTSEYNNLYDSFRRSDYGLTKDEKMGSYANWSEVSDRMSEIEKRKEDLSTLIEKKKYEEKKKAEYDDVIENNIKAKNIMQDYYNLQKYDELERMFAATGYGIEAVRVKSSLDAYNYAKDLTPEERKQIIANFNSIENKDTLYKYYKREREEQETAEESRVLTDYSEEHPVLGSLSSMSLNTYGSIEDAVKYAGAGIDKAFGGDGYINPDSTNVAKAQLIRGKVSENMDGFGKFLYNTTMSIGDNIAKMPLLALPGGKAMSLALAGTSAGTAAANDVINSGGSLDNALLTAVAAGTAEVVFEKIPLDKLVKLKNEGATSVKKAILEQMATEGLEEVGTDIANALTDSIINGDMAQLTQKYNAYIRQGLSEGEAWKKTANDFIFELFQDFSAGAISGGVLSGGAIGLNYATNKIENVEHNNKVGEAVKENENVSGLIETAKKLSPKSKAYKVATQLEKQQKNNKKISSSKVGQLRSLIIEQSQTEFETEYKNVTNNLHPEEKTVVDKLLNREVLSADEVKIVKDNDVLANSVDDLQKTFNNLYLNKEKADKSPFEAIKSIDDNTDKIDESKLNVSQDGKTKINDEAYDGPMEVVRTNPFAETVTYKIEKNGEIVEVSSENIEFKTKEEAKLSALASKYNVQTAQKFLDLYESGQDVDEYSREFNIHQNYGRLAVELTDEKFNVGYMLNNDQKIGAYEAGLTSRKSYYQEQNILSSNAKNSKYYAYTKGKFDASAIKDIQLDETQRAFYNFFREFALRTGINVELFSSKEETGKYQGEQGSWDKNTKTIRIDINAGLKNVSDRVEIKHGMLNTFAHELTHIAENSGFYDELHKAIVNALEKRGTSFDELAKAKKDELVNNTPNAKAMSDEKLTYLADVEVIAECCETMLKNSKIFEDIAQGNPGFAQKLKDKLKNFIARLKQLLNKTNALTHEGKLLEACVTEFEDIQKLWDKAVTDGIKTVNAIHAEQKNNTAENGDVRNSSRYSYNELINKPDMEITVIDDSIDYAPSVATRKEIVNKAVENATKVGYKNANGNAVVKVKDIATDVIISKNALRHGLDRRLSILAPITLNVGDILQNSIRINEMLPKNPNVEKTYVLIGVAKNQSNEPYIVSFVVNRSTNELTSVDVLYSVNVKKEEAAGLNDPSVPSTNEDRFTASKISISDLLDYVNKYYPDILPEDVLKHYNYDSRPDGKLGESVLYQSRASELDNEYLEAVKNNDLETAQRLVEEAAKKAGYNSNSDYQGTSAFNGSAPSSNGYFISKEERVEAWESGDFEDTQTLGDFVDGIDIGDLEFALFDNRKYRNSDTATKESIDNLRNVINNQNNKIVMYRSVPNSVKENRFRNGDWISPSYLYAVENARIHGWGEDYRIIKNEVSIEEVWWDGNDINEWGYDNGNENEVYKNVDNNVKLLTVTYDDNGNVIPLSERFNDEKSDIRYQSRNTKPDYNFSKALNKREWASFYASLEKSNQRNSFRIGDNGILIPDENNSDNYKLVCYDGDSANPYVTAVYKLENYDYNIHSKQPEATEIIINLERNRYNDKQTRAILQNYTSVHGTLFQRYNSKSRRFVKLTRKSVSTREDNRYEPDRAGASENSKRGISDRGIEDDFPQFQMRPDNGFANRRLLADALEKSAQNNYEKNKVKLYKDNIDQIEELEARLDEVNEKIKKASSVKAAERTREQRTELMKLNNIKKILKDKIIRKDKQLLNLESMEPMQKLVEYTKKKAYHEAVISYEAQVKEVREKRDKIIVAEREKRKTMVKGIREARDKKEIIRKTIKKIQDVDKLLNRSKADKTVKQGLRDTASSLISLKGILIDTNISNADIVRQGVETATTEEQKMLAEYKKLLDVIDTKLPELEKYRDNFKKQLAKRSDLSEVKRSEILKNEVEIKREELIGAETRKVYQLNSELKDLFIRERKQFEQLKRAMVRPALSELSDKYKSIENAPEAYLRNSFDKNIIEAIDSFKEEIGGTIVKDMNIEQVQKLHDIVTMILTSIRNANKLFAEDMKLTCEETSSDVMNEILNVKGTKEIRNIIASKILDFQWRNLKPVYAFRLMGSKTFERIYWNLQKGGLKWYIDLAEAKQFKEKCEKKYGYKSFDFKKKFEFKAMDGSTFAIDLNLMMDIYALSRRTQALQHLLKGGFTFEKNSPDGKLKVRTGAKAYPLTMDTIQNIANSLSENEKSYAEEMQEYLSETMAKKGNEVSMALYGVEMFNEDTYWSISSSDTFLNVEENETTGEFKVKNSGFTKSTVRNASNPIVLRGFEESWCNHINQMSLYHAMVLPLEDLTKVFNYNTGVRTSEENPTAVTGVRSVIKGAFGNSAEQYFRQFIRDLNGGIKEASRVGIADNMIALAKKGAVLANFSVTLQQFSSMFRSMAYVDAKYFLPEPNKLVRLQNHRKDWEQLKKYAPIAGIKEMGMFDTGIGKGVLKWLSSGERDTTVKKAKNWVDDKISKPPALMDEYAWIKIWHAIQRETRVKHGFAIGTEENLVKSGERFNEVIHLTQVYDSVFSRSSAMRSNQTFEKMVTSFMAEPTTIMNMAVDAVAQLKRNGKSGIKQFAKSASAILISILANTLLMSIATAGRDDDEDETYGDKYLQSFCTNLINSAIPLNYYPIMRDIMSVLEGYTTERMDMSLVSDFVVSLKKLLKEDGATANNIIDFIGYIANLFGLPVRNVVRDFNAVINTYKTLTTASKDPITSLEMSMPTDYQEAYDKYWKDGYTEEDCKSRAITSVKAKIRKKLKPVYLEALKNQDSATVANIRRYMLDSGFYKSLNDVDEVLKGWRESSDEEDERTQRAEERK